MNVIFIEGQLVSVEKRFTQGGQPIWNLELKKDTVKKNGETETDHYKAIAFFSCDHLKTDDLVCVKARLRGKQNYSEKTGQSYISHDLIAYEVYAKQVAFDDEPVDF